MKTIKDLKEMIKEPMSKKWLKRHGKKGSEARHEALESKKGKTVKDLKEMINTPSSKEWFKKFN